MLTLSEKIAYLKDKDDRANLQGLMKVFMFLCDENVEAYNALYFIGENYKEWEQMFVWLKRNNKCGKSLVELFQNESPDGGGYHMGAIHILSRIKGHKHNTVSIKGDELT